MPFANKVVWITGASSGIGEALAKALAAQGARLVLSARREAVLARVRAACPDPETVALVPFDVAETNAADDNVVRAIAAFARIDMLVNNAGVSQRSLAKDTAFQVDERLMRVNYLGPVALTKALLPHFLARGDGRFVTITSVVGKFGAPWRSGYAASKHALHGWFDTLRAELVATRIGVTLVTPGGIRTAVAREALTGDGSPQGYDDNLQMKGLSAEEAARRILAGVAAGRDEIFVGSPRERMALLLKRFAPGLFSYVIARARVR